MLHGALLFLVLVSPALMLVLVLVPPELMLVLVLMMVRRKPSICMASMEL